MRGRYRQSHLKQNQTKGMLLREQITTTQDHLEIDKIAHEISNCASDGLQPRAIANFGKVETS